MRGWCWEGALPWLLVGVAVDGECGDDAWKEHCAVAGGRVIELR